MFESARLEVEEGKFIDLFDAPVESLLLKAVVISDWYWQIKGDEGFFWSSDRRQRVAIDDKAFQAWLAEGGRPTYIGSLEEMRQVWGTHGIIQDREAQYRAVRKQRYIEELRKEDDGNPATFENTVGDVFDILITQVEAMRQIAGAAATPEFAAMIERIRAIKAEVPKRASTDGGGKVG